MPPERPKIIGVSCSIFRRALESLRERGDLDFPIHYLDSMLHMHPNELRKHMEKQVDSFSSTYDALLLIYGECHNNMENYEEEPKIIRTNGRNCIEIFLGQDKYKKLEKTKVFFLLPEWTMRWREVFTKELGLNDEIAHDFMKDMHSSLLYLDTGLEPVPTKTLEEASQFLGLAYEVMPISLTPLLANINSVLKSVDLS